MNQFNLGILVLRLVFGQFLVAHGYNKVFRGGKLAGTSRWFAGIGMKWPKWQARLAASTEIGAGLLLASGLLVPLASAGIIGLMVVAIVVTHWKNGFFIFTPGEGWEYCASIATAAWVIATVGPGEWSLDHAFDIEWTGWVRAIVAGALGVGGAVLQLAVSYRKSLAKA